MSSCSMPIAFTGKSVNKFNWVFTQDTVGVENILQAIELTDIISSKNCSSFLSSISCQTTGLQAGGFTIVLVEGVNDFVVGEALNLETKKIVALYNMTRIKEINGTGYYYNTDEYLIVGNGTSTSYTMILLETARLDKETEFKIDINLINN